MRVDQEQLQLPMDHDFIVTVIQPLRIVVRAASAKDADARVKKHLLENKETDSYVRSVVRADLLPPPDPVPPNPEWTPPRGKPSPPSGSPGTPTIVNLDSPVIAVSA